MSTLDPDAEFQAAQREFLRMARDLSKFSGEGSLGSVGRHAQCSFCGRAKAEVKALVDGVNACICDACVNEAQRLIRGNP